MSFEKLKPDSKRFKSYLRQLLYYLVISGYDTGILRIRCANYQRMVWIKRESQVGYYVCPRTKNQDGERGMTGIESWTLILEKESLSVIF